MEDAVWWKKAKPLIDEQILDGHEQFSKHYTIIGMSLVKPKCLAHEIYVIDYMYEKGWELVTSRFTPFDFVLYFKKRGV